MINKEDLEKKLIAVNQSKTALEDNLKAHMGAIEVLQQLLNADKEMAIPIEPEGS